MSPQESSKYPIEKIERPVRGFFMVIGIVVFLVLLTIAGCGGIKEFHRYQVRADAHNQARAEKLKVEAVVQRAEQRYQESVGIKRAQDEINKTLTPLYVQHEAIQALERSGAATVYIPSGNQGVPLVRDTSNEAASTSE